PETTLPTESGPNVAAFGPPGGQNDLVSSATGAAGALAGWAFSSISSRLAASDLSTKMATASLSSNPPSPMPGAFSPARSSSPSVQTPTVSAPVKKAPTTSAPSRSTKGKGMALGSKLGTKGKLGNGHADLMA
ncbi:14193_t:CDS:2, partial [Acaulospora colombiana]